MLLSVVKTLVCSLVLSRLDYCNSLLVGLPQYLIKRLQGVKNVAARSILRTPRSEHISSLLQNRHWLPVNRRTLHKIAALCPLFTLWLWSSILVWPYSCLHPCQNLVLFLRYSYFEHSQYQTKVIWSAFFCLPESHCMEFFTTCTQTSKRIWLLQVSFENSSVFSQLMN